MDGWYPDPGGEPGRYRYWDGVSWSPVTSDNPADPPPDGLTGPTRPNRSRLGLVLGVVALVVIVVIAVSLLRAGGVRPTTDDPLPTTSVSGGDDRSPTPTAAATASPSASRNMESPCPVGDPDLRQDHPRDDRVYGGNLSFPAATSFEPAQDESRFTFAHDITQQVRRVNDDPGWIAQLAVGEVRAADGFGPGTRDAAEVVVECAVTSQLYDPYRAIRHDLKSAAVTVDGRPAWLIESEVLVRVSGLPFRGDHTIFVLVPDGKDWGLFFGAVPIGDDGLTKVLDATVAGLRVS